MEMSILINGNLEMSLLFLTLLSSVLSTMILTTNFPHAFAYSDIPDSLDRGDIAEIFDFGSGIFAFLLFGLSLVAYRNMKMRRILFVSIAFGLFGLRTVVSRLDLFMPEIESSLVEMTLAIMSFVALSLFFIAIVRKEKLITKSKQL
jgi:hypothetical protein